MQFLLTRTRRADLFIISCKTTILDFFKYKIRTCRQFIFEKNQTTIVYTVKYIFFRAPNTHSLIFSLHENLWKLTLPGTISAMGELMYLILIRFLSDR
jgi:hypothetical protein